MSLFICDDNNALFLVCLGPFRMGSGLPVTDPWIRRCCMCGCNSWNSFPSALTHLLLSASWGSVPGRLMVMDEGAPTSYRFTIFLHTFNFTRAEWTSPATSPTAGCSASGKKLAKAKWSDMSPRPRLCLW